MLWECLECRTQENTYIRPCRADTGVNNKAPSSCLLDPKGTKFKWQKVPGKKAARRKLRSTSILSLKDIAKSSRVCPDKWAQYDVDPEIDKEAEELAREVESIVLGVSA